jgi:hypothetical protein
MSAAINHDWKYTMVIPCSRPNSYVQEVTAEETGPVQKIMLMSFVEGEITRCVSVSCDEKDDPMEKHNTFISPGKIKRIMAEFDGQAKLSFKYVTTPRYKRQWS